MCGARGGEGGAFATIPRGLAVTEETPHGNDQPEWNPGVITKNSYAVQAGGLAVGFLPNEKSTRKPSVRDTRDQCAEETIKQAQKQPGRGGSGLQSTAV